MNMSEFIKKIIIVGDDVDTAKFPQELRNVTNERISENIDIFLKRTLELQKQEHIMVSTNSMAIRNLVCALNMNFEKNKISMMYEYETDTSELEAELEKMLLHTENESTFFPEETEIKNIFRSDDRILVKGISDNKGTELFNADGQFWGTLLNTEYRFSHICDTVLSQLNKISMKEKAELMLMLMEKNSRNVCSLSDIIMLEGENKRLFFILPEAVTKNTPAETEVRLFTGLSIEEDTGMIVTKMHGLPAVLTEDINAIIMNRKYNTMQLPSNEIIRNTMQRICLMN